MKILEVEKKRKGDLLVYHFEDYYPFNGSWGIDNTCLSWNAYTVKID